jgi:DNA-binding transcriptional LysR family regulator
MTPSHLLRNLRTDDLRYFLAVANLGRLGAAADHLGVDTSTVSRRLRALEKSLGASVLKRAADGWELTDFGRVIAEQARPIEAALEAVARAVEGDAEDEIRGDLRLTVPDGFSAVFAVPALARSPRSGAAYCARCRHRAQMKGS